MTLRLEKIKLLVVEDTLAMRRLIEGVLRALGVCAVHQAGTADRAFDLFCAENHDIVLTDWHMEPTDGIELTRMIRLHSDSPNRFVPIIMCTGFADIDRIAQARDAGVTEFMIKPFTANDLATRLSIVINHPRAFIETSDFFGPDRRRQHPSRYTGQLRRETDRATASDQTDASPPSSLIKVEFSDYQRDFALKHLRVLLVEDNPGVCLITKTILLNAGITQVFIAHDGKKALQFLDAVSESIDIILCDWEMPAVTGIELLRQVRTTHPDMPFIMITSRTDILSVKAAMDSGVDAFIAKPLSVNDLKTNIAKAFKRRQRPAS